MAKLETESFGTLHYENDDVIWFPHGLIGFEQEKCFVAVERPRTKPVIFLQSILDKKVFFLTIPLNIADQQYELNLDDRCRKILGLEKDLQPDLLCLALLYVPDNGPPAANLHEPIIINRTTRAGMHLIRNDSRYSAQHSLNMVFA